MNCVLKTNEKDLIERSIKVLEKSQIEKIWEAGIRRDPTRYHVTVMYPPLKAMDTIKEDQIFSSFQNKSREFTLYVHIPFCSGKCTFCYFCQVEKSVNGVITEYLRAVKKEIEITAKKIEDELGSFSVKSIFFGGGSPTVLSEYQFHDLLHSIKKHFDISKQAEITVEIHPEIVRNNGMSLLETYFNFQVNRLNIGTQSFDDNILQITNRRHTAKEAIEAFELARRVGFKNINIDLLYPLPDLTPAIWEKTLNTTFDLEPESITTYFTAFRKTASIFKLYQNEPHRFPDEYMNHLLRIMTIEKAKEQGYDYRKLIDWFVKPREDFHYEHQKSELKKTEEIQLLSIGSGVFTYLNHCQYFNYPDIHEYIKSLEHDKLPIWRGIKLSTEERLARAMVLGIRSGVVNIRNIESHFREDLNGNYAYKLQKLEELGLVERMNNDEIRLSEKGILFADEIAVQFITQDMKMKLLEKKCFFDPEEDLVDNYNFMYDIEGLRVL